MIAHHPILQELINAGHLSPEQAEAIHAEHLRQGIPVHTVAIEQSYISEEDYLNNVAHLIGTQRINPETTPPPANLTKIIPADLARMHAILPIQADQHTAVFAVADQPAHSVTDDISFALSRRIEYVVAAQHQINAGLDQLYGKETTQHMLSTLSANLEHAKELSQYHQEHNNPDELEHAANTTPVIRFVNMVLYQAVQDHASDIHFEPFEQEFKIRYRVDGALYEIAPPSKHLALPIISRIKVISDLDIAESRLPQDGRLQLEIAGRSIDFRVSTLPTQFGESVVLRVLDRANMQLKLDRIGLPKDIHTAFSDDIQKPNGIVIITGPTGSGKTTTLYAALQEINSPETKILTAEDPVEYDVEGIIQLPIRENIGLNFASALRSFLRQDPDVIMVGEIRDPETAQIAVQASLTGHLVFSTLHTNDAAGAVTRLLDMEIEPYLLASTLEAIMAQRLVRTICKKCKTPYTPEESELNLLELKKEHIHNQPFYRGNGCDTCHGSGYAGRLAIFEYMPINETLRAAILKRHPSMELRKLAQEQGMRTLREDGLRALLAGDTTIEEVVQYT